MTIMCGQNIAQKCSPRLMWHISIHWFIYSMTLRYNSDSTSLMCRIISSLSFWIILGLLTYTFSFKHPQKKKSNGVKSHNSCGQAVRSTALLPHYHEQQQYFPQKELGEHAQVFKHFLQTRFANLHTVLLIVDTFSRLCWPKESRSARNAFRFERLFS